LNLAAIPNLIVLDVSLAARSCHKNIIIKKKKINLNKKANEEKDKKKSELTGLTRQT
jgi:hypothetical protein